jgi:hypothetical protein
MSATLRLWQSALVLSLVFWLTPAARGADDSGREGPAAGENAAKTDSSPQDARGEKSLREQDIYIPYEKLRQVFERHGRGVFLPYEEFEALWRAAEEKTRPAAGPRPPVGAVITEIENEATVAKDVVRVKATVKIDLLAEGWHEIPLRLADAAITAATLGGEPARIVGGPGEDYKLLVEKKGKHPEQIVLSLEYAKAISKMPGQNSVSFQAPQAPVSRWRVRIPQAGVKVNLHPLIAATEVPSAGTAAAPGKADGAAKKDEAKPAGPDETVVLAFVGAAPMVRIDWTPKAEGATGMAALVSVEAQQQVWINEGSTRSRVDLSYSVSRAELGQLAVEVPADYKVVNVLDANVRQWSVEPLPAGAKTQKITAQLFEPAKKVQQVVVELEKFTGEKLPPAQTVPVVKALDVGRQQGLVVVQMAPGLRGEATRAAGLLQVDAADLPEALRRQAWTFSYRYATIPYELVLGVEELQPRVTADSLVEARLEPERLVLDVTAVYTIERAGIFKLEIDVPPGLALRHVHGCELPGDAAHAAAAAQVDSYHLEGKNKDHLVVNLSHKAMGRVALSVQLQKDLQEPKLLAPADTAADIPLPVPQVAAGTVERAAGRLLVRAPESLRVNPTKAEGLRSISFKEALEGISAAPRSAAPQGRSVLAYAFTQEPVTLRLAAQRKKPKVTIYQLLVGRVEQGVVKYQATFQYNILYSGVKSLRIDVPTALVALGLRNKTPTIRDKVMDPQPADVAPSYSAWSFSGEAELIDKGEIELVCDEPIQKLAVGKSVQLSVPRLAPQVPQRTDLAWGQIVLTKAETLDVQESAEPEPTGLRPIDPQREVENPVAGAAKAFEFHGDWTLPIVVTQYQLEKIKRTSIDRAVVRMVVTPAHEISVQALYRVESARQRLEVKLPGAKFDTEPLRVDGRPVPLELGKEGQYFVPVLAPNADQAFLLELRYTVPGDGSALELPVFPDDDVAVQKVYLCVYLPPTRALVDTAGPWSQEFQWRWSPGWKWEPSWDANAETSDDGKLLSWVEGGSGAAGGAGIASFLPDGRRLVFSTLRPAAGAAGSLHLSLLSDRGLSAIVFLVVICGGLALLRAGLGRRALAVGAAIIVLVLAGVFYPTFSAQILNGVLAAAVFTVLVVWSVAYLSWTRPAALARRRAAAAAEKPMPKALAAALEAGLPEPPAEESPPAASPPESPPQPPKPESEGGPSHA